MRKFIDIVIRILVVVVAVSAIIATAYWILSVDGVHSYCRAFIVIGVLQVFALLRLYNAVVQNTRFEIKVHQAVDRLLIQFPSVERALSSLVTNIGYLRSSIDKVSRTITNNSAAQVITMNNLTDELKRNATQTQRNNSNGDSK